MTNKMGHPEITFVGDNATNEWRDSLSRKSTRRSYGTLWRYFLEFTGMTGDQILASRKTDTEFSWEKKVIGFKKWLMDVKGQSESSAAAATGCIRGFFDFHRVPLLFRKQESRQLREATRKTEDYLFNKEDLQRMFNIADLNEKYVIVVGKSFGLRAGDFLRLRRGDFEASHIDNQPPISLGAYDTQKEKVKAYPFIDSDAQSIVKMMLEQMDRKGRTNPNERILQYRDEIQLSRILQRVADRAGIKYGNKNVRFHCLRKFLIDRLSSVMSESKWKQIVGKAISEGAYVSPDSLREDYARAMGETTFAKTVVEGDIELMAKKQALIMLAKLQGTSEDEIKRIFRSRKAETIPEQVKVLEEVTEQKTQTNGDCSNGQHCQRLAVEDELPKLLAEGWRVAAVLPSGKVVVSND